MNRLSVLFISALAGAMVVTATAQQTGLPAPEVSAPVDLAIGAWKVMARQTPPKNLIVVTISKPGEQHRCQVESMVDEQILCKGTMGHTTAYPSSDVAALLVPGVHERVWLWFLGFLSMGGGAVAAAYFVASITLVGAVPLAIIGGFLLLTAAGAGMATMDNSPDTVYYQRPGTTLSAQYR